MLILVLVLLLVLVLSTYVSAQSNFQYLQYITLIVCSFASKLTVTEKRHRVHSSLEYCMHIPFPGTSYIHMKVNAAARIH